MAVSVPRTWAHAPNHRRYDAVIVGARAAGASTAMLLARQGLRVLAVDRDGYGSDTTSSHALMRGAVSQLERWGIAPSLRAVAPAIENVIFHYGDNRIDLPITKDGASALLAPRRTVLDRTLVDAAADAGAEIRHRTRLVDIDRHPAGRVCGLVVEDEDGNRQRISTDLLIGADGLRSSVARRLDVPITRQGTEASAYVLRYLEDVDLAPDAYQWLYGPGIGAGVIPTTDGQFAVFAGMPRDRYASEIRTDVPGGFQRVLDEVSPEVGEAVRRATPVGRARSWPGTPGQYRKAFGPGWALVGDAGYFKDPYAAHGISDALRDAELLANAVVSGDFEGYERTRDRLSGPLFDVLERIASYDWTLDELPTIHLALGKAMSVEQKELATLRAADRLGSLVAANPLPLAA